MQMFLKNFLIQSRTEMPEDQRAGDVSGLLQACRAGDRRALEDLFPLLSRELHRIAKHQMATQPAGHTLQTTALVNEAYLHLIDAKRASWLDRSHFIAACSQIMRRILVDHARSRQAAKRGGGVVTVSLRRVLGYIRRAGHGRGCVG